MPRDPNPHSLTPDIAPEEQGYALSYLAYLAQLGFARRYGRALDSVRRPKPGDFAISGYRARRVRDRIDGWVLAGGQWWFKTKEEDE